MSLSNPLQNHFRPDLAGWWFFTCQQQLLCVPQGSHIPFGQMDEMPVDESVLVQAEYLCDYQGEPCYSLAFDEPIDIGLGEWVSLYSLLNELNSDFFNLAGKAMQRQLFLKTHRFCGQCGQPMQQVDWELAMQCPSCGFRAYPRLSPSIIVGIRKGSQILLAQHNRHTQRSTPIYTVIAGFVEGGETLEQCVLREVQEEVGLKVDKLRYVGSQPWPFPHSMMVAYLADYADGAIRIQRSELKEANWFEIDQLPPLAATGTIARRLIDQLCDEIRQEYHSPRIE
ncbi:NAD(+) diphosphatase [Celerinatantimonas sp. YJH-8]|uniref:NAD(+) diphosphatase n=1 Tax=Celerinatantimonas sp. YJH-8 TaxID=3228714 RepID=UPI0038C71A57